MSAVDIQRVSLINGEVRGVAPPSASAKVTIINITGASLRVYSKPGDATAYLEIADGFSWLFELSAARGGTVDTAFYLVSGATGTAILLWQ